MYNDDVNNQAYQTLWTLFTRMRIKLGT